MFGDESPGKAGPERDGKARAEAQVPKGTEKQGPKPRVSLYRDFSLERKWEGFHYP